MEICYDGTLVMPSSYAVMNEEEMTYVEGGCWEYQYSSNNIAVPMKAMYMSKAVCLAFAVSVIISHRKHWYNLTVNGMGAMRIASELYAHALVYYGASALNRIGIKNSTINEMRDHASTADIGLGDGLDAVYALIWAFA